MADLTRYWYYEKICSDVSVTQNQNVDILKLLYGIGHGIRWRQFSQPKKGGDIVRLWCHR